MAGSARELCDLCEGRGPGHPCQDKASGDQVIARVPMVLRRRKKNGLQWSIIKKIDAADTKNFMVSSNYMQEAIDRGWYNPAEGKPFWND